MRRSGVCRHFDDLRRRLGIWHLSREAKKSKRWRNREGDGPAQLLLAALSGAIKPVARDG
jgi:hypothetical protein